ncbi:endonuclease/exonuclease/phosphatase family protein [Sinomicrobium soli]|uniref:endonuclease/exonuclease/phosphatase family protein n=1 Tax=Sinomicrobium sp. N-1-3-6 TaxID=2219864 RepID=UPI0013750C1F|nr:endonuclease/exonuclease/phosphatase family protein [Sinomicrobium sp. N-1-3-6]
MKYLYVLFALLCFASCANERKNKGSEEEKEVIKNTLKVMSYNIHIAQPPSKPDIVDIDAIVRTIEKEDPDLVALQEVDRFTERSGKHLDQAKAIADKLGMHFYFAKATDRSNGAYGLAVLSKYAIINSNKQILGATLEVEPRTIGVVEVEIARGKKLLFATTHLDHHEIDEYRAVHAREMIAFLKDYADFPIIIGGDFNMLPDNQVWQYIEPDFKRACETCPNTAPTPDPIRAIDHFLLNGIGLSTFDIVDFYTVNETYASDHLPIVMKLEY